jgi:Ankyrin repeat
MFPNFYIRSDWQTCQLPIIANAENFNVNTAGVTVGFILQLSYQYFGQLIKFNIIGKNDGEFPWAKLNVIHESQGMTPLYIALYEDCIMGIVRFLVENGANTNFGDEICPVLVGCIKHSSMTCPAFVACKVKYLLEKGTNPNQFDERGVSVLMLAINCR